MLTLEVELLAGLSTEVINVDEIRLALFIFYFILLFDFQLIVIVGEFVSLPKLKNLFIESGNC